MSGAAHRLPLAVALHFARALREELLPACEQIEIAGSIRRMRPDIGDIEIVARPKMIAGPKVDFFAPAALVSALDAAIAALLAHGTLTSHPVRPANGARYKRLWSPDEGVQVDLFICGVTDRERPHPADWGPLFAIRTGPAEFSEAMVTRLRRFGRKCEEGRVIDHGVYVPCPTEEQFFDLCETPFLRPEQRQVADVH